MNHRYGRHGFNAWCRLREHRLKQFTHPVVSQACVTVIHVHVKFMHSERIFVVALDENGMQIDTISSVNIVDEHFTMKPLERQKPDPLEDFKHHAKQMGGRKAGEELASLEEPSTEDMLRSYAQEQGSHYAIDHVTAKMAEGKELTELEDIYADAFLEGYREYRKKRTVDGSLPDEPTRRIKRKAREDKALDRALNKQLSSRQIGYQAAIRALEMLHLNTQNNTDYLDQIEKFAKLYYDEYTDQHKEVEKSQNDRSNIFRD